MEENLRKRYQLDHKASHHHGRLAEETGNMRKKKSHEIEQKGVDNMLLVG